MPTPQKEQMKRDLNLIRFVLLETEGEEPKLDLSR